MAQPPSSSSLHLHPRIEIRIQNLTENTVFLTENYTVRVTIYKFYDENDGLLTI
ncbi:hypothetical protein OnM2_003017 [Erysiphe neolycopersici]|uniref:Uncharacterized protein n=1 Tax=Erysiphe neolycopersici TaxID=212602 RepID=A0A420I7T7_9PEZI|nr:hypothetical protein OnM2_003017 [Erysiphe neolycopersici]